MPLLAADFYYSVRVDAKILLKLEYRSGSLVRQGKIFK